MIPYDDFGGSGPPLHFAHANGYPPRAYAPLLEALTPHYRITAMRARPLWPGATPNGLQDWTPLTHDLVQFLNEQGLSNLYGVGHSLGAVTTLDAALRRPELFRAIVLLDPVIFPPAFVFVWRVTKALGLGYRLHPLIPAALLRRRVFASVEEMFERYRRAPVFSGLDDPGLRAYVHSLARLRPDGAVELAYSPEWEARIYYSGPLDVWDRMADLSVPMLLIYGAQSDTFRPAALRTMRRRLPHAEYHATPNAGHLVPMERPAEVGSQIIEFLARQRGSPS
jgi:pimeloyl-ACP methyl ester carboxylesterase